MIHIIDYLEWGENAKQVGQMLIIGLNPNLSDGMGLSIGLLKILGYILIFCIWINEISTVLVIVFVY